MGATPNLPLSEIEFEVNNSIRT